MRSPIVAVVLAVGTIMGACGPWPPDAAPVADDTEAYSGDDDYTGPVAPAAPLEEAPGIRYDVELSGDGPESVMETIRRSSILIALKDRPPALLARLEARIDSDLDRFRKVLRSEGYYAAVLDRRVVTDTTPYRVEIQIGFGPLYTISENGVRYVTSAGVALDGASAGLPQTLDAAGLLPGAPARSADVVAAGRRLIRSLQERGYPFAKEADRRIIVDHRTRRMAVTLTVAPGPIARLGDVAFAGLETVDLPYLRRFVTWEAGDLYDRRKLDVLAARLRGTGLFQSVLVEAQETPDAAGRLPVNVKLVERAHRSVGFGGEYASDLGLSATIFWEHRNFFGRGERLRASTTVSESSQQAGIDVTLPHFRRPDQDIVSESRLSRQTTDAFDAASLSETLRIERKLSGGWRAGAGGALEYSVVEDDADTEHFTIFGLPAFAARDTREPVEDPVRGARLRLDVTPYRTFVDKSVSFLRAEILGAGYLSLAGDGAVVAAGRVRVGSIVGAVRDEIPATKRFFAGGGGSIRGIEFQRAGQIDAFGEPVGGSSLIEAALELRIRVAGPFGVVTFVDTGNVYDTRLPGFSDPDILVGAGIGLRYRTPVGPLRLDVAAPVNPREDIDSPYQLYLSFGQAF